MCAYSLSTGSAPVSWFFNFSSFLFGPLKLNLLEFGGLCNLFLFIFYRILYSRQNIYSLS